MLTAVIIFSVMIFKRCVTAVIVTDKQRFIMYYFYIVGAGAEEIIELG